MMSGAGNYECKTLHLNVDVCKVGCFCDVNTKLLTFTHLTLLKWPIWKKQILAGEN